VAAAMSEHVSTQLMPGEHLCITPDSYRTHERHHEIADRLFEALHYDPSDVVELRVSEGRIQLDVIDRRHGFTVRTHTYEGGRRHGDDSNE
jgi:hypothetical protein